MDRAQADVCDFNTKIGNIRRTRPMLPTDEELIRSGGFITEEIGEYWKAVREKNIVGIIDALADIKYFVDGLACGMGVDMDPIMREVHRSNMTKGNTIDAGGKLIKSPNWSQPAILGCLIDQGYRSETVG